MQQPKYHWKRRTFQFATIILIVLVPATGLLKIDLTTASFVVLDHQMRWSNIFFVFGLGIIIATTPIITYMTIGTIWCGWSCPQNTVSEWANNLTHKLLGKRADVDIDSEGLKVAAAKNKAVNWIALVLIFVVVSLLLGAVPFLFFYTPGEVWSFVTFSSTAGISRFMQQLYIVVTILVFMDIAVIRYFWCDYICLYRIGQRIFRTKDALHVKYDMTRSGDCAKCNYCATSCITGIDPTNMKIDDSCINCGECIDACNRLHERKGGGRGLLKFQFSEEKQVETLRGYLAGLVAKFNWWVGSIFLIGCLMFLWGILKPA
jgi:polyferredoxin